jgi:hypothetical protein
VFEHNEHQLDQAKKFAREYNISLQLVKSDRFGGEIKVPINWSPKRNKEIIYDIV